MKINKAVFIPITVVILLGSLYCLTQKNLPGNIICLAAMVGLLVYASRRQKTI